MPPAKIRSSKYDASKISGEKIEILVGEDRESFSVHENLLRTNSPFFDKAMAGEWRESSSRTVEMPNDEPEIFAIYIQWLYSGKLSVRKEKPPCEKLPFDKVGWHVGNLKKVKAYVLGDKILDARFQDACIDEILGDKNQQRCPAEYRLYPAGEAIEYAYNNTCESAPIRRLFVDIYAVQGIARWLSHWEDTASIPQPFLFDLSSRLMRMRAKAHSLPHVLDPNEYHISEMSDDELLSGDESLHSEFAAKLK